MARQSAGLLLFRRHGGALQVLLVHPGGPFWARKDLGVWSLPKGELGVDEDPLAAAKREFHEETGFEASGAFIRLSSLKQPSGKIIHAWALAGNCDPTQVRSNTVAMDWPRGSGRTQEFPEIDRAAWFGLATARRKILRGQILQRVVASGSSFPDPE